MNFKNATQHTLLALFHLALGVLLLSGFISKVYSILIVLIGFRAIVKSQNDKNQAIYWAAYMVGAEVLFRMSGGMIFHELPKYSVFLFLLTGLYVENKRHHVSVSYVFYMLLLLIGIAFIDIPFNESIRKAIAFNLSGPILLGLSAIYFYHRKLSIETVLNMLFVMVLPVISMLSLLYFKTPDLKQIAFGGSANFVASGGFGPNQVATILGLGIFIIAVHLFFEKRIFPLFVFDAILLMYLVYRGLITFSRGGILTAVFALLAFMFFYMMARRDKLKQFVRYAGFVALFGIVLIVYTADATGGMLINRYTNKNARGIEKADISTGRIDLFKSELDNFYENPFFGIGVGGSKYERLEEEGIVAASHNEVSRLLSEHGMIGLVILFILIVIPVKHILTQPYLARAFLSAFLLFWFLTINHSAMRIAFPAFIYGLSLMQITFYEHEEVEQLAD
ncbi:O-antigen ligase domain-containing protein [Lutibacter sp. HS1-25]|uniref:O-antigen ligase family protein n=1 Tax=Lutibacter sp. HS1-25 TaxID=2485000 RepID=UPI001013B128|nr:O-antigen ligase family protein [Lutibacter sp. HS1-25]RXP44845.1 O-antigen ligase domain-containing protein [Lutibacter sp. HS1-25]